MQSIMYKRLAAFFAFGLSATFCAAVMVTIFSLFAQQNELFHPPDESQQSYRTIYFIVLPGIFSAIAGYYFHCLIANSSKYKALLMGAIIPFISLFLALITTHIIHYFPVYSFDKLMLFLPVYFFSLLLTSWLTIPVSMFVALQIWRRSRNSASS